eukprot:3687722-Pyramimonas_sp.AAC.1
MGALLCAAPAFRHAVDHGTRGCVRVWRVSRSRTSLKAYLPRCPLAERRLTAAGRKTQHFAAHQGQIHASIGGRAVADELHQLDLSPAQLVADGHHCERHESNAATLGPRDQRLIASPVLTGAERAGVDNPPH